MAFFRKKIKLKDEEPAASPAEQTDLTEKAEDESFKTSLSFPENWDGSDQEKYILMFKHQTLKPLQKNQLSIEGYECIPFDEGFLIMAFMRNTLDQGINLETIDLVVLDSENNAVARKSFGSHELSAIPAMGAIPCRLIFSNEDKIREVEFPTPGWSIAFEIKEPKPAHQLDLDGNMDIAPETKQKLEQLLTTLPELGENEVNMTGIQIQTDEESGLNVTLLIRNGNSRSIQLESLPLQVVDADGDIVCKGQFQLTDFHVKANASKPWTFRFPAELVEKKQANLTRWSVQLYQNE